MNEQTAADAERFVRLFAEHEPRVRAFVRAGLPSVHDANEVMQEVSVVAWRKFGTLQTPEGFGRWLCVIARFEILKYRRTKARDRLVLDDELLATIAEEGEEELDMRAREIQNLQSCLKKLPEKHRQLVIQAYSPGQSKKILATQVGKTQEAMYQLLSRLRLALMNCIGRLALNGGQL
ncbi:hypothetical protein IMCC26134_04995 [Verrucomicrobia bacterium IMCC26134]|jgi:RNA polymerase sigma-70 factor (ECF subfamily)|nr:hypothetical protein IMCC26134_04995 [Verrucomicrobia bacterium IMCC26134]